MCGTRPAMWSATGCVTDARKFGRWCTTVTMGSRCCRCVGRWRLAGAQQCQGAESLLRLTTSFPNGTRMDAVVRQESFARMGQSSNLVKAGHRFLPMAIM